LPRPAILLSLLSTFVLSGVAPAASYPERPIARLHREIRAALNVPAVRDRLAAISMQPVGNTPAGFKAFLVTAIERYAELVKLAGIQPE